MWVCGCSCSGQRKFAGVSSPSTLWVPGLKLQLSVSAAGAFTHTLCCCPSFLSFLIDQLLKLENGELLKSPPSCSGWGLLLKAGTDAALLALCSQYHCRYFQVTSRYTDKAVYRYRPGVWGGSRGPVWSCLRFTRLAIITESYSALLTDWCIAGLDRQSPMGQTLGLHWLFITIVLLPRTTLLHIGLGCVLCPKTSRNFFF